MNAEHLGSDFDCFLEEEGLLEEAETVATKRVLAYQFARTMEEQKLTKAVMARRMKTSRSALGTTPARSTADPERRKPLAARKG